MLLGSVIMATRFILPLQAGHSSLEKTSLPVAEISFLLGFSEPNSFYRAFRAWTGATPDEARRAV
ncbi:helix-turn-helix domain-containing protein [Sorangium sp. So ce321]